MERKTKTIIVITLCVAIVGLSVGYAALNSILNIAGNAKVGATAANWNISFKNVNCEAGGYAEAGSISSTGTTITISESKLKAPKDYVICTFDVVNDGTIDAEVTSVTVPDPNSFTYEGQNATYEGQKLIDVELVENGLVAEMKYNNTSKDEIKIGDKLNNGESKSVYIKIEYSESVTQLPNNDVAISDIFGQIIFGQLGSSGSEEGGGSESLVYSVGDAVYYNPVSGVGCDNYVAGNSLSENKSGCMKWYVINDVGATIDVLLDHNTTYKVKWISSTDYAAANTDGTSCSYNSCNDEGPVTANNQLASDVSGWVAEAKSSARMVTADEVWKITESTNGKSGWNSATSTDSFYFEGSRLSGQGISKYAWLFDYTSSCTSYGCNTADSGTSGYWTTSPSAGDSNCAWYVYDFGTVTYGSVYTSSRGVRPVITISKSNLSQ